MATRSSHNTKSKYGIIILGNAGAGKSFICNIIIGRKHFKSDFLSEAVTTQMNTYTIQENKSDILVYDIPGLMDDDEERIRQNKEEIKKAFETCPDSIVIFVWSNVGGRFQPNDTIAFKALYRAYKIERESLFFVVNNLDPKRSDDYDAKFLTKINIGLEEVKVDVPMEDTCFIEIIDPSIRKDMDAARDKLMLFFATHKPAKPKLQGDIIVPSLKELKDMREALKLSQKKAELDKKAYECRIDEMTKKIAAQQNVIQRVDMERRNAKISSFSFDDAIGGSFGPQVIIPAAVATAAVSGAVRGGVSGAVRGFASGYSAVADPIRDFAEDRDIPLPVRVVATPVAILGGAVVAPVAAVGGAVIKGVDGALNGISDCVGSLFR